MEAVLQRKVTLPSRSLARGVDVVSGSGSWQLAREDRKRLGGLGRLALAQFCVRTFRR